MKNLRWLVLLTVILAAAAFSQSVERDHDIDYADYLTQAFIMDCAASPDGRHTAYVEYRWDKQKDGRNYDLWMADTKTKAVLRLTSDMGNEYNPQWSPDGKTIYFVGHFEREGEKNPPFDGKSQVWNIRSDGSELKPITRVPGGIDDYQVLNDGFTIFFTKSKDRVIDEWKELRSEYKDELEFGRGIYQASELWKLDLTTWRETKLVASERFIRYFEVSPDGQKVAMITDPDELLISHEGGSEVEVFDVSTGEVQTLPDKLWREDAPSPYGWLGNLAWSSDGNKLAFTVDFDGYPMEILVAGFGRSGDVKIRRLQRPPIASAVGGLKWLPGKETICFLGDYKARTLIYAIDCKTGASKTLTPGDVVIDGFDFIGTKGGLIAIQSEMTYYRDLALYNSRGKFNRITNVNPQYDAWKLPQISIVKWQGAEGDTVEGILELPPDYKGGEKLPLLVNLHGGPTASEKYCFLFWIYGRAAFAAKGYAMFSPNYRGSTGYGDKFMTDLVGHENDYDVKDILTGVDALIERGIADPGRLGVMGWSNGGYLTNCLLATNRFKVASSGAGIIDMAMQWGEEDTPGHVINFQQGLPWENPDLYRSASPLYSLKPGIKTATLIHVGGDDPRVPPSHSKALFRALHHYLDVPCELIIYPGAHHGLSTYKHRLAKMKWDHAWFDKYMGEGE